MKVIISYFDFTATIRIDYPIEPQLWSHIIFSEADMKKLADQIIDNLDELIEHSKNMPNWAKVFFEAICEKSTYEEKFLAIELFIDVSSIQNISVAWDEKDNAYIPVLEMGISSDDDDLDDDDDDETDDEDDDNNEELKTLLEAALKTKKLPN
ncbi:MAG: hypothetical protein HUK15_10050 [Bacteroidales bacterium]|nr:hypothetical protein [Bacteroidales bacterium]